MDWTMSNIIQIGMYLIAIGTFVGVTKQQFTNIQNQLNAQKEHLSIQITNLEKKVDKHNNVIERMYKCEESIKSAHHRIDELRGSLK